MSTKHNVKHNRLRRKPRTFGKLEDPEVLKGRQERRAKATGSPVKVVDEAA
jgi:hypothetical protein